MLALVCPHSPANDFLSDLSVSFNATFRFHFAISLLGSLFTSLLHVFV
jgi:hypothetical protein